MPFVDLFTMLPPDMRTYLFTATSALLAFPRSGHSQQACFPSQAVYRSIVHEQSVSINTDVLHNTTFYAIPEVAVTVHNAPTSFDGITTFRWTETETLRPPGMRSSLASASQASVTATADDTFVLMVMEQNRHQRRQTGTMYETLCFGSAETIADAQSPFTGISAAMGPSPMTAPHRLSTPYTMAS